ncbi:hypothetical protein FB45DRAFT_1005221 [Roridomyces roridus]|uniref:Uncharacterized protein n=1 Tax=Roridomyces roridus TaxID=1738132 RepID=A0AAD7FL09_9AGAR|nr:hypothetical protein FB45DRAFT_1005221 [Roridomyces roridus]
MTFPSEKGFPASLNSSMWRNQDGLLHKTLAKKSRLCLVFPTSRGLKLCHETFENISVILDTTFAQSRQQSAGNLDAADRIAVAVLRISCGMAEDAVLRSRFFRETHVMAILSEVTHINDAEVLLEIARRTSTILDSVELHWDRIQYVEKAACVLSHGTSAALARSDPAIQIHVSRVLEFLLRVVSRKDSTPLSFYHLLGFCATNAGYADSAPIFSQNAVDFLVACTRSPYSETRVTAHVSLLRLRMRVGQEAHEPETTPGSVRAQQVLAGYYREGQSHHAMCLKEDAQLLRLLERYKSDSQGDLSELAEELSNLVLRHESMVRSRLQLNPELVDMTVACAAAVESNTGPAANILRLVLLLSRGEPHQASELVRASLERHPSMAFFYYVMAECHDFGVPSALLAEKGLECSSMTNFVRRQLRLHSAFSSLRIVAALVGASSEVLRSQEAETLIEKGSCNAKTFVDVAQLDHPDLPFMTALSIHFDILKKGHTLTEDDFQVSVILGWTIQPLIPNYTTNARDRFALVCDVARCTEQGFDLGVGNLCVTLDEIFARMPNARSTWGSTVSRQPMKLTPNTISVPAHADPNAALAAWLKTLHTTPMEDLTSQIRGMDQGSERHGKARLYSYCDNECQKKHWKVHRALRGRPIEENANNFLVDYHLGFHFVQKERWGDAQAPQEDILLILGYTIVDLPDTDATTLICVDAGTDSRIIDSKILAPDWQRRPCFATIPQQIPSGGYTHVPLGSAANVDPAPLPHWLAGLSRSKGMPWNNISGELEANPGVGEVPTGTVWLLGLSVASADAARWWPLSSESILHCLLQPRTTSTTQYLHILGTRLTELRLQSPDVSSQLDFSQNTSLQVLNIAGVYIGSAVDALHAPRLLLPFLARIAAHCSLKTLILSVSSSSPDPTYDRTTSLSKELLAELLRTPGMEGLRELRLVLSGLNLPDLEPTRLANTLRASMPSSERTRIVGFVEGKVVMP